MTEPHTDGLDWLRPTDGMPLAKHVNGQTLRRLADLLDGTAAECRASVPYLRHGAQALDGAGTDGLPIGQSLEDSRGLASDLLTAALLQTLTAAGSLLAVSSALGMCRGWPSADAVAQAVWLAVESVSVPARAERTDG